MNYYGLIFGMFLVTYIPRMLPGLFMNKIKVKGKVALFMRLIPITAMTAMVFPAIISVDDKAVVGVVACVVALIASYHKMPIIVVVIASVLACLALYLGGVA